MSPKNICLLLFIAFSVAIQAQPTIKRESDFIKMQKAIGAKMTTTDRATNMPKQSSRRASVINRRNISHAVAEAAAPVFYSAADKIAGRNISDYAGDFLQYTFSHSIDPAAFDFQKQNRSLEFQHGPVWFLQTLDGDEREVTVSKNSALFLSLGWAWGWLDDFEPDENIADLQGFLGAAPYFFTNFEASLDYEPLPSEAIIATQSPVTYWPVTNEAADFLGLGTQARVYSRAAIGGNFLMLKPLSPGTHVIKLRFNDQDGNLFIREFYLCVL